MEVSTSKTLEIDVTNSVKNFTQNMASFILTQDFLNFICLKSLGKVDKQFIPMQFLFMAIYT